MTEAVTSNSSTPVNRPARVALIAGLLSWIPGVGLIAILAGLVAGARARATGGAGRGAAFMGVTLGITGLFLSAVVIGAVLQARSFKWQAPAIEATKKFILLVGSGQVASAKSMTTDAIDIEQLTNTAEQFHTLGGFTGDIVPWAGKPLGDGVQVEYRLPFAKADQIFSTDWVFVNDQPKLNAYRMYEAPPDPSTQPATKPVAKK